MRKDPGWEARLLAARKQAAGMPLDAVMPWVFGSFYGSGPAKVQAAREMGLIGEPMEWARQAVLAARREKLRMAGRKGFSLGAFAQLLEALRELKGDKGAEAMEQAAAELAKEAAAAGIGPRLEREGLPPGLLEVLERGYIKAGPAADLEFWASADEFFLETVANRRHGDLKGLLAEQICALGRHEALLLGAGSGWFGPDEWIGGLKSEKSRALAQKCLIGAQACAGQGKKAKSSL